MVLTFVGTNSFGFSNFFGIYLSFGLFKNSGSLEFSPDILSFYPIYIKSLFFILFHLIRLFKDTPVFLLIEVKVSPFLTVYPPVYNLGIEPPVFNVVTGPLT